jgi:hypothetical protein
MLEVSDNDCYDINDSGDSHTYIDSSSCADRRSRSANVSQVQSVTVLAGDALHNKSPLQKPRHSNYHPFPALEFAHLGC